MTEPITPEDLALLPEDVRACFVNYSFQPGPEFDTHMNFKDRNIVLSALIASQKRVRNAHILELVLRDQIAAYEKRVAAVETHLRIVKARCAKLHKQVYGDGQEPFEISR